MLAPMNYRRGFHPPYAALTLLWVAALFFSLPSDSLNFWSASQPAINKVVIPTNSLNRFGDAPVQVSPPFDEFKARQPSAADHDALAKEYAALGFVPSKGSTPLAPGATLVDP